MSIVFHCACGRPLRASADNAGKKTKCPGCGQLLIIPAAEPVKAAAVAAPVGPGLNDETLSLDLDWSAIETPRPADSDSTRSSSGGIKVDTGFDHIQAADIPRTDDGSRQYHVLTQKDMGFAKFNPVKLEEALNIYACQGWSIKTSVVMNLPGHGGNHDELIVILER